MKMMFVGAVTALLGVTAMLGGYWAVSSYQSCKHSLVAQLVTTTWTPFTGCTAVVLGTVVPVE